MSHLEVKVDSGVFLLKDPKVDRLRTGRLSVEAFALLIAADDPYVLIDDTVYALTEREYYALRAVKPMQAISETAFRRIVAGHGLDRMSDADRARVESIARKLPGCPACMYKRYKGTVWKLAKKYGIDVLDDGTRVAEETGAPREYPGTTGQLAPVATSLMDKPYRVPESLRVPCLDCVEKHLSQAAVLAGEALNGYPEYLGLVIGHLAEALDELPTELHMLKGTVEFCLARTQFTRRPFVPLAAVAAHIEAARAALKENMEVPEDADDGGDLELDFGETAEKELEGLDQAVRDRALGLCHEIVDFILPVENPGAGERMHWEGLMASLADALAPWAPAAAAVVRARRLMFVAAPALAVSAGCSMEDLLALLEGEASGDGVLGGLQSV